MIVAIGAFGKAVSNKGAVVDAVAGEDATAKVVMFFFYDAVTNVVGFFDVVGGYVTAGEIWFKFVVGLSLVHVVDVIIDAVEKIVFFVDVSGSDAVFNACNRSVLILRRIEPL